MRSDLPIRALADSGTNRRDVRPDAYADTLNTNEFVWGDGIRSIEELGQVRMLAMRTFLDDFDSGKRRGRYVRGERSPFVDRCVSDLNRLGYQVTIERVPYEFQRGGNEMMRVRSRTRIGGDPIASLDGTESSNQRTLPIGE